MATAFLNTAISQSQPAPSVRRALRAIRAHQVSEDRIDDAILSAINVTLCLMSNGDDRVAEGFNRDIAISGGRFPLN